MSSKTILSGGYFYTVVQGMKVVLDKALKAQTSIVSLQ